jgi:GT2 family glycosyltransferase
MDVSIIVVNWNTKELLIGCLRSVYDTTAGLKIEVIVVDNGSYDGSSQAVKESFPQVMLIQNAENEGFAKANNQALSIASGRYNLLLNSDALLTDGSLTNLVNFMDKTPEAGIAACQYINREGSKQNSFDNFPTLVTELLNKSLLKTLFPQKYPSKKREYHKPMEVDSVIGACMIVRKEAIIQVGMLDEDYFFFMEETDWCFRMHKAGWKIYHLPEIKVYHLQGQSKEKNPSRAWIEYYRSNYTFFKKYRSDLSYLTLRIFRVCKLIINLFFVLLGLFAMLGLHRGLRRRFRIYRDLLIWHLTLCPASAGLREMGTSFLDADSPR